MERPTSMAPLRMCRFGWKSVHQIFSANYGFHLSSPYGTFLRKPTMRECQKLRDFSPCGVSRGTLPANQFRRQESEKPMNVEIWSDVACPWCYIGVLD